MKQKQVSLLGQLAALFVALTITTGAQAALPFFSNDRDEMPTLAPMLQKTTPAVVSISVEGSSEVQRDNADLFRYFFGQRAPQVEERPFRGLGSGVIIDADKGYVVTNHHVIDRADKIIVTLTDGRELKAKLMGADPQSDIALLKVEPDNLTAVKVADSDALRVGDFVVAIGNPFGLSTTVTSGIVSALGRAGLNLGLYQDFIQTDAAINKGNSGGALVNLRGELVGINTAVYGPGGANIGIGFAIPSKMMQSLVEQIIKYGEVRRGLLGIIGDDLDAGLAEAMGLEMNKGAFVREVVEDSPAQKGGIKAGDIILAIDGKRVRSFQELRARVGSMGAGTEVTLDLIRDGKKRKVKVTLGDAGMTVAEAREVHPALDGATLEDNKTRDGMPGVLIAELEARSAAARIGLAAGDVIIGVNRQRVHNIRELNEALEDKPGVIALTIRRGNSTLYLVIR